MEEEAPSGSGQDSGIADDMDQGPSPATPEDALSDEKPSTAYPAPAPFIRPPIDNRANRPQRKVGLFLSGQETTSVRCIVLIFQNQKKRLKFLEVTKEGTSALVHFTFYFLERHPIMRVIDAKREHLNTRLLSQSPQKMVVLFLLRFESVSLSSRRLTTGVGWKKLMSLFLKYFNAKKCERKKFHCNCSSVISLFYIPFFIFDSAVSRTQTLTLNYRKQNFRKQQNLEKTGSHIEVCILVSSRKKIKMIVIITCLFFIFRRVLLLNLKL